MTNHPNRFSRYRYFRVCPRGFLNEVTYYKVPVDKFPECEVEYANFEDNNPGGSARWIDDRASDSKAKWPGVAINWADRNW